MAPVASVCQDQALSEQPDTTYHAGGAHVIREGYGDDQQAFPGRAKAI